MIMRQPSQAPAGTTLTWWLAALATLALVLSACAGEDENKDKKDGSTVDAFQCSWPPNIEACDPPPNAFSDTLYYCWGCTCAGATSAAACNPDMQDCRFFYNGCYPQTYKTCDQNQTDTRVLAMCEYCFLSDAGGLDRCNTLLGSDKDGTVAPAEDAAESD